MIIVYFEFSLKDLSRISEPDIVHKLYYQSEGKFGTCLKTRK